MRTAVQIDSLEQSLLAAARPGGGWAYYRGREGRIEPTAWAMLALEGRDLSPHLEFLARLRREGGLLLDPAAPAPNYGWNGLTLLALDALPAAQVAALRTSVLSGLTEAKGVQLSNEGPRVVEQDGQLQAWSWTPGTFSWVEPTSYCLLAFKRMPDRTAAIQARIDEAERVLLDRVCPEGGWNYGNSVVLDQELRPYVPTTALGLLAMQDQTHLPAIGRSLAWLETHALEEPSAMALSVTALALSVCGRRADHVLDALVDRFDATGFLDNAHLIAAALYALSMDRHGARHVRIDR